MLLIGTFSFCAFTRSMSAKSCGVLARKVVKTPRNDGSRCAAATSSSVACCRAWKPRPARSWTRSLKPPAVPSPRTGGGGMTKICASWISDSRCCRVWISSGAVGPFRGRSSNGSGPTKMAPAFDALERVAPENPANATANLIPGVSRMISLARRTTASVRSSDAPSGSWIAVMK